MILVTGGAGYIGSHTVLELLERGCGVVVADNLSNSCMEAITRMKRLSGKDFPFYEADVRDDSALDKIFSENKIDCIIHFAGLKAVGESVEKPLEYYEHNLGAVITLCKAMRRHDIRRFIFSSSACVYSGDNEMPLTEQSTVGGCFNPYGWTKYMCEQILRDAAFANEGWSVALLRYFNPVGAHESGDIGEDPQGVPNNLMPYIAQTAVGRRDILGVNGADYETPDGTCVRDYIHVTDLAKGHVAAIKYLEEHTGAETFNLGTGKGTSVLEMIRAFEKASDIKIPYKVVGRRAGDLPAYYAATDKARRVLGWEAEKTIEDACADLWRWQKRNPNGYK